MIDSYCQAEKVFVDGIEIDASILSEGIGESEGIVLLDRGVAYYLTSNATDIKLNIEKLNSALNKLVLILTAIGSGMTGPTTAPPPTLVADLAEITAIVGELAALKESLK